MKHLLKRDTFTTRRTKEVIEGDEQIFFKNKNVIAFGINLELEGKEVFGRVLK